MILPEGRLFNVLGDGQGALLSLLYFTHCSSSCLVIFSNAFIEHLVLYMPNPVPKAVDTELKDTG